MTHEIHILLWLALGLGMDAFSASIGIGTLPMSNRRKWLGSLLVGSFHVMLPLIGVLIGQALSHYVSWIGAALLIGVGLQMIRSGLKGRTMPGQTYSGWRWLIFGLGVSIDSLTVGITLGLKSMDVIAAVCLFGLVATIMTRVGLQLGTMVSATFGRYSEVIGGSILVAIAFRLLTS